jgi:ubiquinone/menaquinone biosynthesis C-methylase UbiE
MQSIEAAFELDITHPNYQRWQRAIDFAVERGKLICSILDDFIDLKNSTILDAGCGVGGTSIALQERGAMVTALDRDPARLEALRKRSPSIELMHTELEDIPLPDESFNGVVLQDVLEHVNDPGKVLQEVHRVLASDGLAYISTPNRHSILNIISDPHWGLAMAALKSREDLRTMLRKHRPADAERSDLAQLFSYKQLAALLADAGLEPTLRQKQVTEIMFTEPEKVVWTKSHLSAIRIAKKLALPRLVQALLSNNAGIINRFISPAWYIVARKASE